MGLVGRLFWVDQQKNAIESCNFDGTDRTVLFNVQSGWLTTQRSCLALLLLRPPSDVQLNIQGGPENWHTFYVRLNFIKYDHFSNVRC